MAGEPGSGAPRPSRRAFLTACGGVLAAGCAAPTRDRTGRAAGWAMAGRDAANTAYDPGAGGPSAAPAPGWIHDVQGVFTLAAPAVADGRVLVASKTSVYAIDAAGGDRIWTARPGGTGERTWASASGLLTHPFTPAVAGDLVVAGARAQGALRGGAEPGRLVALDAADGAERWAAETHVTTSPTAAAGRIYLGNTAGRRAYVRAFDPADGRRLWTRAIVDGVDPGLLGAPAVADGVVYAAAFAGDGPRTRLAALDAADGTVLWRRTFDGAVRVRPTVADGRVFAVTDGGTVRAFGAAGGEPAWAAPAGAAVAAAPAAGDGALYVLSADGFVALDAATGAVRWRTPQDDRRVTALAATADAVYAGGFVLTGVDAADGTVRFERRLGESGGAFGAPAVAGDALYVGACVKTGTEGIYDNDVRALR